MQPASVLLPLLILASVCLDLVLASTNLVSPAHRLILATLIYAQVTTAVFALVLSPRVSLSYWIALFAVLMIGAMTLDVGRQMALLTLSHCLLASTALLSVGRMLGGRIVVPPATDADAQSLSLRELLRLTSLSALGFAGLSQSVSGVENPFLYLAWISTGVSATLIPFFAMLGRERWSPWLMPLIVLGSAPLVIGFLSPALIGVASFLLGQLLCGLAYAWVLRCCGWRLSCGTPAPQTATRLAVR